MKIIYYVVAQISKWMTARNFEKVYKLKNNLKNKIINRMAVILVCSIVVLHSLLI